MTAEKINHGRQLAFETFSITLQELLGRNGITEEYFRDAWARRLCESQQLTSNGWYDPPPGGMAVFFGHDNSTKPFGFASLRPQHFWPSNRTIDWNHGLMYAYCSPIHIPDGMPGDFGITLYFGNDSNVRSQFRAALAVTRQLISEITPGTMARTLFRRSEILFADVGMRNNVVSVTDSVPVDLGHSLPRVQLPELGNNRQLKESAKRAVEKGRLFISESTDWPLSDVMQFTIEPNLVSVNDLRLPQVSPHYAVSVRDRRVRICDECDALFDQFNLLPPLS
jgi:hypothetical protein